MTLAWFQVRKYGSCIVSSVCIFVCVWLCVSVWTIASSMDAPAKHRLLWRCQETVAFLWRQTAPIRFGWGFSLRLSIFLPPLFSFPSLPQWTTFSSLHRLYFCLFVSFYVYFLSLRAPCDAAQLKQAKRKRERGKDREENRHQFVHQISTAANGRARECCLKWTVSGRRTRHEYLALIQPLLLLFDHTLILQWHKVIYIFRYAPLYWPSIAIGWCFALLTDIHQ